MNSGLFGSSGSAMKAIFTPLPVAYCEACGTLGSVKAVLLTCRASGSSSGLLGSVGQVPGAVLTAALAVLLALGAGVAATGLVLGLVASCVGRLYQRSVSTEATFGSAASRAASAAVTCAAKPL